MRECNFEDPREKSFGTPLSDIVDESLKEIKKIPSVNSKESKM